MLKTPGDFDNDSHPNREVVRNERGCRASFSHKRLMGTPIRVDAE